MERKRRNTDRFLPEWTLGGTVLGLSFPQHDEMSEPVAEQKHQPIPAAIQPNTFPFDVMIHVYE